MNIDRRLLSLAIALVAAAIFVVVFRSAPAPSAAPVSSSATDPSPTQPGAKLKMSPRIVNVPAATTRTKPVQPETDQSSPARPWLLFLLAFASGWWLRQWMRNRAPADAVAEPSAHETTRHHNRIFSNASSTNSQQTDATADNRQAVSPDDVDDTPAADFPTVYIPAAETTPDELDEDLSNTAQIEVLQERNVAKAEIIKTLEDVVMENREKWLNWDETEARMSAQIDELTRELNNAMRQAFRSRSKNSDSESD